MAANVLRPWHPGAALSYRLKRMQGPSHLERTLSDYPDAFYRIP